MGILNDLETNDIIQFLRLAGERLCICRKLYYRWFSEGWHEWLGWTEDELKSSPSTDIIHPDDVEGSLEEVGKLQKGLLILDYTNRIRKKDGSWVYVRWSAIMPNLDTEIVYASARDVTNQISYHLNYKQEISAATPKKKKRNQPTSYRLLAAIQTVSSFINRS